MTETLKSYGSFDEPAAERPGQWRRRPALLAAVGLLLFARAATAEEPTPESVRTVFVIAMENHNLVQPNPASTPRQILGNPAAPFLNSLLTPGSPQAAQVSYARAYYNAGLNVHPSEANYVWAEAGTDFGVHTDADPNPANFNTSYDQSVHLTRLLNQAGIAWKNYQENVELSSRPTHSASGTNAPTPNPYYGTTEYHYAVKHNPMAFFADTAVQNVYPLSQLFRDLSRGAVGRYNWITPNLYNDAHSSLSRGFTYHGVHYIGNQSAVAQGDNFLATVVPQLMASSAYRHNGMIIFWWAETEHADAGENGDDTSHVLPEIVISPLAKGNAYASTVPLNHSSDLKTMTEIFHLPYLKNPIPPSETTATGDGYNNVALVNDLSDLLVPGALPAAPEVKASRSGLLEPGQTGHF